MRRVEVAALLGVGMMLILLVARPIIAGLLPPGAPGGTSKPPGTKS